MHLPVLKDSKGNVLEPENLLLHRSELGLMFKDKNTQQLINFDLETGKIIDEIKFQEGLVTDGQITISNDKKNSQTDDSQIF